MSYMNVIKIHDGEGPELLMVSAPADCRDLYRLVKAQFGTAKLLIDLSQLPEPTHIVQSQAHADDVAFCFIAPGFYPETRQDIYTWLVNHGHDPTLITLVGDLYVVLDMGQLTDIDPEKPPLWAK